MVVLLSGNECPHSHGGFRGGAWQDNTSDCAIHACIGIGGWINSTCIHLFVHPVIILKYGNHIKYHYIE